MTPKLYTIIYIKSIKKLREKNENEKKGTTRKREKGDDEKTRKGGRRENEKRGTARKREKGMEETPAMPTIAYIVLVSQATLPNKVSTRLKLKNPINPQLIAPIITKVKTIASNVLTVIPPLYIKFFTVLTNNMLINYTYIHKLNFLIDFYIFYSYNST